MANYTELNVKSLMRTSRLVDPWFLSQFGMNLYRGCEHACAYCDGRAAKYRVDGDFARDIVVKRNSVSVLAQQLRKLREKGFVLLGGGVSDAYQPAEEVYELARQALQVVIRHDLAVHVVTKSALVERDFDLLARINDHQRAIVSFSIQTLDERVRAHFEPGAAPIEERLRVLRAAKERGFATGIMAMPVLPGISDRPKDIDALFQRAKDSGVDFVLCGGLTMRPGSQSEAFFPRIQSFNATLLQGYQQLFREQRPSGAGDGRYYKRLQTRFDEAQRRYRVPGRIPRRVFHGIVPLYTEVAVLLEHMAFFRGYGDSSKLSLERAGTAIQKWARRRLARDRRLLYHDVEKEFLSMLKDGSLCALPNINDKVIRAIQSLV